MKRLANYLIATALLAFTLTSCEDVPSPFGEVVPPPSPETDVIDPAGSGTEKDPYNVAGVLEFISGLGADTPSEKEVYIKGYAVELTDISAQYGNATFTMSDDVDGKANKFTVYRAAGLGNQKVTDANFIKQGDVVVICGKVINYKGNTPETVQGSAYVYSVNGETGGGGGGGDTPSPGEAKGSGTQADPYNAAGANNFIKTLAADKESDKDIYIKGKLVKYADKGEFSKDFGNASFYLSDDGKESSEQFYVFRTLYLGNVKYTSGDTPKVGDEIIICGKVVNYKGNTPETAANKSYIYSWNGKTEGGGGGSDTPSGDAKGSGTEADPYNVTAAIAKGEQAGVYVKGFIVGFVDGQAYDSGATFSDAATGKTNVLIAASASETDPAKCMPVQLPNGAVREGLNLQDNKGYYKKEVTLYGDIATYFKVPGIKNTSYALIDGKTIGTKPGEESGGESGGGGSAGAATLDVNFKTNGQGDWTIANINLPDGLDYVWTYDNRYGMKASAYVNSKRYVTDCWLVSPTLNLANNATMTFKQALNYATSEYVKVMYTTTNGTGDVKSSEWKEASVDKWPAGSDWNFIESKATLPAGTVRVAFRYTSTADKAATWEIESLSIK